MIKVLSAAQMQECDRAAIEEYSIPGIVLMENAGLQVVDAVVEHLGGVPRTTAVVCGTGNNGGDGLVVARHLHNLGSEVVVFMIGAATRLSADAAVNYRIARAMDLAVIEVADEDAWGPLGADLEGHDCIVDALLGTGLRSAPQELAASVIASINASGAPVVAVDLPSGLAADAGKPPGAHVVADLTVTFAALKPCHLLWPASEACGELQVVDISIPDALMASSPAVLRLLTPDDAAAALPRRSKAAHKGSCGRVLVIGGAPGTAGAAVLAARAALRGGAGLVDVATPQSVWGIVGAQLTEALAHALPAEPDGSMGAQARERLQQLIDAADVVALGPGIGTGAATRLLVRELAVSCARPLVLDADALNALAGDLDLLRRAAAPRLLTPHPGEMGRLLGADAATVQADRPAAVAEAVRRSGAVVLLKGHRTLVGAPDEVTVVNPTGNAGMASGGTGDVLTGLIAALLGQGAEPFAAAWLGAWLHGRAGDLVAARVGEPGLIASDIIEALPGAMAPAATESA